MQETLGYMSGILVVVSSIPYIRDIFLKKTTPARSTWFIWSILLAIAFFAQISEGATWSLLLTGADFATVLFIFILSIKRGEGGATRLDIFSLVGAGISLIVWYLTSDALYAIILIIVIDFFGGLPTLVKAYKSPYSETTVAYMICAFGALVGVFAVGELNFALLIFPAWICLFNFSIGLMTILGKRRLLSI